MIHQKTTKAQAFTNARLKYYPDKNGNLILWSVTCFPDNVFKKNGFEESGNTFPNTDPRRDKDVEASTKPDNRKKSFNRAKNNLFDLLMCNTDCDFFVTLTFDGAKVNRFSYPDLVRKLNTTLDNGVRRKHLKYILVPEFHRNGAVHFHGLMNADVLGLCEAVSPHTNRKIKNKGKQVYNITGFKWGFSTAIRIGDSDEERQAVAKYVYKYVTKIGNKVGGRYYLHGGDLRTPTFKLMDINYFDVPCEPFSLSFGGECKVFKANGIPDTQFTFLGV